MTRHTLRVWITLLLLQAACLAAAQRRMAAYDSYIRQYAPMAVEQMKRHHIPASITLAQGLLESGAGKSTLARESNNHFGIKCGMHWRGRSVRHDDDAPRECFRAYRSVADSYEDHSLFLVGGQRYAGLFRLDKTDYRGWATGLKRAGYATDPSYANKLIGIIETYDLYKYDTDGMTRKERKQWEKLLKKKPWLANPHELLLSGGVVYVVARAGDTFKLLSSETGVSKRKLIKYNDLHKGYTLQEGDIIYLDKKNKKWKGEAVYHEVRPGDSMHSISQLYTIRLKNLYRLNRASDDHTPEVGDRVWLK